MHQCYSVGAQNGQKQSFAHKLSKIHLLRFKAQPSSVKPSNRGKSQNGLGWEGP